jgi:hypothetical protein
MLVPAGILLAVERSRILMMVNIAHVDEAEWPAAPFIETLFFGISIPSHPCRPPGLGPWSCNQDQLADPTVRGRDLGADEVRTSCPIWFITWWVM